MENPTRYHTLAERFFRGVITPLEHGEMEGLRKTFESSARRTSDSTLRIAGALSAVVAFMEAGRIDALKLRTDPTRLGIVLVNISGANGLLVRYCLEDLWAGFLPEPGCPPSALAAGFILTGLANSMQASRVEQVVLTKKFFWRFMGEGFEARIIQGGVCYDGIGLTAGRAISQAMSDSFRPCPFHE